MSVLTYRTSSRPTVARNRVQAKYRNREHSLQVRAILHRASVQPKLTIGAPNDHYEQEADRVAEQVMRMPEPRVQRQDEPVEEEDEEKEVPTIQTTPLASTMTPWVQRQPELEAEEEKALASVPTREADELGEEKEDEAALIQAKHVPGRSAEVTPGLAAHIQSLRGGGQPLPASTRAFFEPRFGHDFRQVRVHTEARAAETARALNAHAFTVGRDVVFGAGQYAPDTLQGQRLLGHELTHVVQQHGRQLPRTQSLETGEARQVASSLGSDTKMTGGFETPSKGRSESRVNSEGLPRRGLVQGEVISQRPDSRGNPRKGRVNFLSTQHHSHGRRRGLAHGLTSITPQDSANRLQRKIVTGGPDIYNFLTKRRGIWGVKNPRGSNLYWISGIKYDPDISKQILYEMLRSGRIFHVMGRTLAETTKAIDDHVEARKGVVNLAATKRFGFATGFGVRMRKKYWKRSFYWENGRLKVRWWYQPGVSKLQAMKDAYRYAADYDIACWAATKITMHAGSGSMSLVQDNHVTQIDWIPGDWGYIKNTRFRGTPGRSGMNIIYVGHNKFWGHISKAVTYDTLSGWENYIVVKWRGKDKLLNWRRRTGVGIL